VIAHGGSGTLAHIQEVIEQGKADAVAIASMIHYDFLANRQSDMSGRSEGNVSFLNTGRTSFGKIQPQSLKEIKSYLAANHIPCRL
jgi:cyclase